MSQHARDTQAIWDTRKLKASPSQTRTTWPEFYEKMRMDIIEAQCAVQSGRAHRAIELMEEMLRDAASCDRLFLASRIASPAPAARQPSALQRKIGTRGQSTAL